MGDASPEMESPSRAALLEAATPDSVARLGSTTNGTPRSERSLKGPRWEGKMENRFVRAQMEIERLDFCLEDFSTLLNEHVRQTNDSFRKTNESIEELQHWKVECDSHIVSSSVVSELSQRLEQLSEGNSQLQKRVEGQDERLSSSIGSEITQRLDQLSHVNSQLLERVERQEERLQTNSELFERGNGPEERLPASVVSDLTQRLDQLSEVNSQLRQRVDAHEERFSSCTDSALTQRVDLLSQRVDGQEERLSSGIISDLNERLEKLSHSNFGLLERVEGQENRFSPTFVSDLMQRLDNLSKANSELVERVEGHEERLSLLAVSELTQRLDQVSTEHSQLLERVSSFGFSELTQRLDQMSLVNSQLLERVEMQEERLKSMRTSFEAKSQQWMEMETSRCSDNTSPSTTGVHDDGLRSRVDELMRQMDIISPQVVAHSRRLDSLVEDCTNDVEALLGSEAKMRRELDDRASKIEESLPSLVGQVQSLTSLVNDYSPRIESLEGQLHSLKTTSSATAPATAEHEAALRCLESKFTERDIAISTMQKVLAELSTGGLDGSIAEKVEDLHRRQIAAAETASVASDAHACLVAKFEALQGNTQAISDEHERFRKAFEASMTRNTSSVEKVDALLQQTLCITEELRVLGERSSRLENDIVNVRKSIDETAAAVAMEQSPSRGRPALDGEFEALIRGQVPSLAARLNDHSPRLESLESEFQSFKTARSATVPAAEEHEAALHCLESKFAERDIVISAMQQAIAELTTRSLDRSTTAKVEELHHQSLVVSEELEKLRKTVEQTLAAEATSGGGEAQPQLMAKFESLQEYAQAISEEHVSLRKAFEASATSNAASIGKMEASLERTCAMSDEVRDLAERFSSLEKDIVNFRKSVVETPAAVALAESTAPARPAPATALAGGEAHARLVEKFEALQEYTQAVSEEHVSLRKAFEASLAKNAASIGNIDALLQHTQAISEELRALGERSSLLEKDMVSVRKSVDDVPSAVVSSQSTSRGESALDGDFETLRRETRTMSDDMQIWRQLSLQNEQELVRMKRTLEAAVADIKAVAAQASSTDKVIESVRRETLAFAADVSVLKERSSHWALSEDVQIWRQLSLQCEQELERLKRGVDQSASEVASVVAKCSEQLAVNLGPRDSSCELSELEKIRQEMQDIAKDMQVWHQLSLQNERELNRLKGTVESSAAASEHKFNSSTSNFTAIYDGKIADLNRQVEVLCSATSSLKDRSSTFATAEDVNILQQLSMGNERELVRLKSWAEASIAASETKVSSKVDLLSRQTESLSQEFLGLRDRLSTFAMAEDVKVWHQLSLHNEQELVRIQRMVEALASSPAKVEAVAPPPASNLVDDPEVEKLHKETLSLSENMQVCHQLSLSNERELVRLKSSMLASIAASEDKVGSVVSNFTAAYDRKIDLLNRQAQDMASDLSALIERSATFAIADDVLVWHQLSLQCEQELVRLRKTIEGQGTLPNQASSTALTELSEEVKSVQEYAQAISEELVSLRKQIEASTSRNDSLPSRPVEAPDDRHDALQRQMQALSEEMMKLEEVMRLETVRGRDLDAKIDTVQEFAQATAEELCSLRSKFEVAAPTTAMSPSRPTSDLDARMDVLQGQITDEVSRLSSSLGREVLARVEAVQEFVLATAEELASLRKKFEAFEASSLNDAARPSASEFAELQRHTQSISEELMKLSSNRREDPMPRIEEVQKYAETTAKELISLGAACDVRIEALNRQTEAIADNVLRLSSNQGTDVCARIDAVKEYAQAIAEEQVSLRKKLEGTTLGRAASPSSSSEAVDSKIVELQNRIQALSEDMLRLFSTTGEDFKAKIEAVLQYAQATSIELMSLRTKFDASPPTQPSSPSANHGATIEALLAQMQIISDDLLRLGQRTANCEHDVGRVPRAVKDEVAVLDAKLSEAHQHQVEELRKQTQAISDDVLDLKRRSLHHEQERASANISISTPRGVDDDKMEALRRQTASISDKLMQFSVRCQDDLADLRTAVNLSTTDLGGLRKSLRGMEERCLHFEKDIASVRKSVEASAAEVSSVVSRFGAASSANRSPSKSQSSQKIGSTTPDGYAVKSPDLGLPDARSYSEGHGTFDEMWTRAVDTPNQVRRDRPKPSETFGTITPDSGGPTPSQGSQKDRPRRSDAVGLGTFSPDVPQRVSNRIPESFGAGMSASSEPFAGPSPRQASNSAGSKSNPDAEYRARSEYWGSTIEALRKV